jgi:hypothetical protein
MVSNAPHSHDVSNSKPSNILFCPEGGNTMPLVITFKFGFTLKIPFDASAIENETSDASEDPRIT